MAALPATTAHLRVLRQCFQDQCVEGAVSYTHLTLPTKA